MSRAPIWAIDRLRMGTDGAGVTTLVCFYGCPLRCRWCINPTSWRPGTRLSRLSPRELLEQIKRDHIYFSATGGGVTFGGGEPLLHAPFIAQFARLCPEEWNLRVETALNVPTRQVNQLQPLVSEWIVDIKDINPEIYRSYTGRKNALVLDNLRLLVHAVPPERVLLRLPLIPSFNTEADVQHSRAVLEEMGFTEFEEFSYQLSYNELF